MKIFRKKEKGATAVKKPEQKLTLIGLILYGLIMLSLIIIYKGDFLISVTAVVVMLVMVVQYIVPILRERKLNKGN